MTDYSDKRNRYRGLNPSDFAPGNPRHNNPQKQRADIVYKVPATRTGAPRDAFRTTTKPKPPEPPPAPTLSPVEPEPSPEDYALPDTHGTPAAESEHEL